MSKTEVPKNARIGKVSRAGGGGYISRTVRLLPLRGKSHDLEMGPTRTIYLFACVHIGQLVLEFYPFVQTLRTNRPTYSQTSDRPTATALGIL